MYIVTDGNVFMGKDDHGRPIVVTSKDRAMVFRAKISAENFLRCLPENVSYHLWRVCALEGDRVPSVTMTKTFANTTKETDLEDDDFDICEFFTQAVQVMSQIDRFILNMTSNEQLIDMKILDVRHYIRDNNHKLNAIQMQRLGYYLQELEKERYEYKSKKLIASIFASNVQALKDKNSISKMNDILTSRYQPRILDDTDIEYIINKKKEIADIA